MNQSTCVLVAMATKSADTVECFHWRERKRLHTGLEYWNTTTVCRTEIRYLTRGRIML